MSTAPFGPAGRPFRPFRPSPDPDLYFPAESHEAAVAALVGGYRNGDGVALVDGDPGVGKTLVGRRFLSAVRADGPRVLVPAARFARPADLFQAILFDLGAEFAGRPETELRLAVADRLLAGLAAGAGPAVVVLDEAHHLSAAALEEVRLLGNLESRAAKAVYVVLVALPRLRRRLDRPALAPLAQRLAVRCRVDPLTADEAAAFVRRQMAAAAPPADITHEALALLVGRCGGVPRRLNQVAAAAVALAAAGGEPVADVEAVVDALVRVGLGDADPGPVPPAVDTPPPVRRSA